MRHHSTSRRLGVKTGHRVALLRNLLRSLVRDGRIKTTVARAKVLRPYVEKIVTRLKEPTVANIRHVFSIINDKEALNNLVQDIAPKFKARTGGYLRILKLATRRAGDNADMALVEWVDEALVGAALEKRQLISKAGTKKTDAKAEKSGKSEKKAASKKDSKKASEDELDDKAEKTEKKAKKAPAKKSSKKSA